MKAVLLLGIISTVTLLNFHSGNAQLQANTDIGTTDGSVMSVTVYITNTNAFETHNDYIPAWRLAIDDLQLIMTSLGFAANVLTMVLLWRAGQRFTSLIKILLQHQSFVDGLICLLAIPLLTQPFNWLTGNKIYDEFMCHIWHSQVFFWSAIYVSVWNLVLVAIERYIAVIHPLQHNNFTKSKLIFVIILVYVTATIVLFSGFMQVSAQATTQSLFFSCSLPLVPGSTDTK